MTRRLLLIALRIMLSEKLDSKGQNGGLKLFGRSRRCIMNSKTSPPSTMTPTRKARALHATDAAPGAYNFSYDWLARSWQAWHKSKSQPWFGHRKAGGAPQLGVSQ